MEHPLGKAALIGPRHRCLADSSRLDTVGAWRVAWRCATVGGVAQPERHVREPDGLQRHPSVKYRNKGAGDGQVVRGNAAAGRPLQGLQRQPGAAKPQYGPLHAPRGKRKTLRPRQTRPLFDDNVYQRGEVLVLKPASNGRLRGFEADRAPSSTAARRRPSIAPGAECYRAAPGRRAVRVDKHDRRLFKPTP